MVRESEVDLWLGPEIVLEEGHEIQDLGVVQIPPGLGSRLGSLAALELALRARYTGEGAGGTLDLDWVQLTALDGWCEALGVATYALPAGDTLVIDGGRGRWAGCTRGCCMRASWRWVGAPADRGRCSSGLERSRRLYLVAEDADGVAGAELGLMVQAFYRPRRLGL